MRSSAFWKLVAASLNCLAFIWVLPSSMNSDVTGFTRVACVSASIACTHVTRWHQKTHTNTQTHRAQLQQTRGIAREAVTRGLAEGNTLVAFFPGCRPIRKRQNLQTAYLVVVLQEGLDGRLLGGLLTEGTACTSLPVHFRSVPVAKESSF